MKIKRPFSSVIPIANQVVLSLIPYCARVELAGSLRRKKAMIGDIEVVAIPHQSLDFFGNPAGERPLDRFLVTNKEIRLAKNGSKYKQFHFTTKSGHEYQVDLFLQTAETWGVNFMIRTGSADFSRRMVTSKNKGGYKPNEYVVSEARVWLNGSPLETPEEEDVFRLWGMDFIPPGERT